jgi:hypothetical protein
MCRAVFMDVVVVIICAVAALGKIETGRGVRDNVRRV